MSNSVLLAAGLSRSRLVAASSVQHGFDSAHKLVSRASSRAAALTGGARAIFQQSFFSRQPYAPALKPVGVPTESAIQRLFAKRRFFSGSSGSGGGLGTGADVSGVNKATSVFMLAAAEGDLACVKQRLDHPEVDVCAQHNHALVLAAEHGRHQIVWVLLNDERINPPNNMPPKALFDAVEEGNVFQVFNLLTDLRHTPVWPLRAIEKAATAGHGEVVELLLEKAQPLLLKELTKLICVAAHNADGVNLTHSSVSDLASVVECLVSAIELRRSFLRHNLEEAKSEGRDSVVRALEGSDQLLGFNELASNSPIVMAAARGDEKAIKSLLTYEGFSPSVGNNEAVRAAAYEHHDGVVEILLNDKRVYL